MARAPTPLGVSTGTPHAIPVLAVEGVLDSTTYLTLRDRIIKEALDEPSAVFVDVSALQVPAASAWSVFTSARWHVSIWPGVQIALVCAHAAGRQAITRSGVARYVPVFPAVEAARNGVHVGRRGRRCAHARLPATMASLSESRRLVREVLATWSQSSLIPTAMVIVNALMENVLRHTRSAPLLRLETDGETVTVAVADASSVAAQRRERRDGGADMVSGLAIVAALSRAWGSTPTPSGKTVWAVIGPENRL